MKYDIEKISKKVKEILATGEMYKEDLQKGGEWYDTAKELASVAKPTGRFVKVLPFDNYQGPYAQLNNGAKIWMSENEGEYTLEDDGKFYTLTKEEIAKFYKTNAEDFIENIVTKKPKKVKKAEVSPELKEAKSLLKDLEKISSKVIQAGNELRDVTAVRGKDMSQWRRQKGVSSPKVKDWVDALHKLGFINASLDKAAQDLVKIEKEIKDFIEKE